MPERRRVTSHVHIGFIAIGTAFLGVLLMGTLWKLGAGYAVSSPSPWLREIGKAAFFQYG
jgi:hypothetical protein